MPCLLKYRPAPVAPQAPRDTAHVASPGSKRRLLPLPRPRLRRESSTGRIAEGAALPGAVALVRSVGFLFRDVVALVRTASPVVFDTGAAPPGHDAAGGAAAGHHGGVPRAPSERMGAAVGAAADKLRHIAGGGGGGARAGARDARLFLFVLGPTESSGELALRVGPIVFVATCGFGLHLATARAHGGVPHRSPPR